MKIGDKVLFNNFNIKIREGEKVLLNAPSGSGKSTLFRAFLGFQRINSGEIIFDGKKLAKNTLNYFRQNSCYVSQDVDLRNEVVSELLKEIFSYKCNKNTTIEQRKVKELFSYFDLQEDMFTKNVKELSGGERQRLGLIICILLNRKIWLLDEVTSGLDKKMKEKVVEFILKSDKTVIIISHDSDWVKNEMLRIVRW